MSEAFVVETGDKTILNTALCYGYLVKLRSDDSNLRTLVCALYDYAMAPEAFYDTFKD
ncbi:MAG: hypothetical protein IJK31_06195 [Ruminococcus sp.]|nr:hypothetical protein [Ruminococcus sp.]